MINPFNPTVESCPTDDDYPEEADRNIACWWRGPDAATELIARIQGHYDAGYRRVAINRPVGTPGGLVLSALWGVLPDLKKEQWEGQIKDYLESVPDLDLGLYSGFKVNSACDSFSMSSSTIRVPDITRRQDAEWYKCQYGPFRDIGVKFIILDTAASAENREAFEEMSAVMWSHGIKLMGESIPKVGGVQLPNGETGQVPDDAALDRGAYMFLEQHIQNPPNANAWPFWEVDPSEQEAHIFLQGRADTGTLEQTPDAENFINDWFARGFTVSVWNTSRWFYTYVVQNFGNINAESNLPEGFPYLAGQFDVSIESAGEGGSPFDNPQQL